MQKNISEVGCLYPMGTCKETTGGANLYFRNFLVPEKIIENYIPKLLMEETKKW